jgi:hypothetical protein
MLDAGVTPFADPRHAAALARPGERVVRVAAWDGAALLLRPIPGTARLDAAAPYPLFGFDPSWDIAAGLDALRAAGAISAVIVADPLAPPADTAPFALVRRYKRHHLVEGAYAPSEHHRAELRRAARRCEVEEIPYAAALPAWQRLYAGLVARKGLAGGLHDFGPGYAAALAPLGPRCFAARDADGVVAMALWLRQGAVAWYHLAAAEPRARGIGAGYLVVDAAIRALLAEGVETIQLGGGLAEADAPPCGLDRFKAGFANAARVNLLLGAVLDAPACAALGGAMGGFFPAYRRPERVAA